jgi:succinyl-CoA synthetase beta subunit
MARLLEHEGKRLLAAEGIPIPRGEVAATPAEARTVAAAIGGPVAVKAQIRAGRRGKAGGIRFATDPGEAAAVAGDLLGAAIQGRTIDLVLVEERLDVAEELYLAIVVDTSAEVRGPVALLTAAGGVDVEEVHEERLADAAIDVHLGLLPHQVVALAQAAGLDRSLFSSLTRIAEALYRVFTRYDCRTIEVNPLVVTGDRRLVAADCRTSIDDNSVFRHPEMGIQVGRETDHRPDLFDEIAWSIEEGDLRGTGYVARMRQDIPAAATVGYHGVGGGGAILGVDALNRAGLAVADYADTSGNPTAAKVYRVAKLVLSLPGIDGYCLGGFIMASQEQWHHAHGLVKALREEMPGRPGFPVVILLCGNREEEAHRILHAGLDDLPARIEIYGRDRVYDTAFIAGRTRALVDAYRAERRKA